MPVNRTLSARARLLAFRSCLHRSSNASAHRRLVGKILIRVPPRSRRGGSVTHGLLFRLTGRLPVSLLTCGSARVRIAKQHTAYQVPSLLIRARTSGTTVTKAAHTAVAHSVPPPILIMRIIDPNRTGQRHSCHCGRARCTTHNVTRC